MRIDRPVPSDLLSGQPPVDSSFVEDSQAAPPPSPLPMPTKDAE